MSIPCYRRYPSTLQALARRWLEHGPHTVSSLMGLVSTKAYRDSFSTSSFPALEPGEQPAGLDWAVDQCLHLFSPGDLAILAGRYSSGAPMFSHWKHFIWLMDMPRFTLRPQLSERQVRLLAAHLQPDLERDGLVFAQALRSNVNIWWALRNRPNDRAVQLLGQLLNEEFASLLLLRQIWDWLEDTEFKLEVLLECWRRLRPDAGEDELRFYHPDGECNSDTESE